MKFLSIQYLRAISALLVVTYHSFNQLKRLGYTEFDPEYLSAGVDIFFVISGFIMWYTTFKGKLDTRGFLQHRIIRIVPLYWILTTLYVIILLIRPHWMLSSKFDLNHIVASYLFIPTAHPIYANAMWPLIVPGWTLNYEMFFYLLFSLTLIFDMKARAGVTVAILAGIVCLRAFNIPKNSVINFYTSSIILEFAGGIMLGYLYTAGASIQRLPARLMILGGLASLMATAFVDLPGWPRIITFGVPAFLIVAGAVFYEQRQKVVDIRLAKLIGDASYSIYLSHAAVLSALGQLWHEFIAVQVPGQIVLFPLNAVVSATIAGIMLYLLVERPIIRWLKPQLDSSTMPHTSARSVMPAGK